MSLSPTEPTELDTLHMDALTAAYDAGRPELVENIQEVMTQIGMDPNSEIATQIADVLNQVVGAVDGMDVDENAIEAASAQLATVMNMDLKVADPVPGREMMASENDQVELEQKDPVVTPSVGGPIGI